MTPGSNLSKTLQVDISDPLEAVERCYELGWTDGLPTVPPTVQRVNEFLDSVGLPGSLVIGEIPERRRTITLEKVASNAVMAGCIPEYFPAVIAATEAILDPQFNLIGPSSSLGGAGILLIFNGPVVPKLGINSRNNLFGPGNRANSTIGRSIRLILMNACAAIPGLFDRSVIGHPGKYSYCIAEAQSETHWEPLSVQKGFTAETSTVTAFAAESPRQVRSVGDPNAILYCIADVASSLGTSLSTSGSVGKSEIGVRQGEIVVTIAGHSSLWKDWSKIDIQNYLHQNIKKTKYELKKALVIPGEVTASDSTDFILLTEKPEDIMIVFAGGEEADMSSVIPSWGPKVSSTSTTKSFKI
jgi:hypothetical protein